MVTYTYRYAIHAPTVLAVFISVSTLLEVTACSDSEPPEAKEIAINWAKSKDPQVVKCRKDMETPRLAVLSITGVRYTDEYGPGSVYGAMRAYKKILETSSFFDDIAECKTLAVPRKVLKELDEALSAMNSYANH